MSYAGGRKRVLRERVLCWREKGGSKREGPMLE